MEQAAAAKEAEKARVKEAIEAARLAIEAAAANAAANAAAERAREEAEAAQRAHEEAHRVAMLDQFIAGCASEIAERQRLLGMWTTTPMRVPWQGERRRLDAHGDVPDCI